jgi:hypothetical protein
MVVLMLAPLAAYAFIMPPVRIPSGGEDFSSAVTGLTTSVCCIGFLKHLKQAAFGRGPPIGVGHFCEGNKKPAEAGFFQDHPVRSLQGNGRSSMILNASRVSVHMWRLGSKKKP